MDKGRFGFTFYVGTSILSLKPDHSLNILINLNTKEIYKKKKKRKFLSVSKELLRNKSGTSHQVYLIEWIPKETNLFSQELSSR